MKKTIFLFTAFALITLSAFANPVGENKAKQAGQSFLLSRPSPGKTRKAVQLRLAQTPQAIISKIRSGNPLLNDAVSDKTPEFYVFNVDPAGFIIVSGDDRVTPVLGYSNENSFDPDNIPPNAAGWLETYREQIEYAVENNISPSPAVRQQWDELLSSTAKTANAAYIVAPLIQTQWNQGWPYNILCPTINGQPTYTGCIATAMAQIMNYHRHPAVGSGQSPAYTTPSGINIPSVDFSATTYDWANMTDTYSNLSTETEKAAVATLMYHCGISVKMQYNTTESGAYDSDAISALSSFFGYSSDMLLIERNERDDESWGYILKVQLDKNLPVYYSGRNQTAGHAFVCDGYSADNYFHFNWGWGGSFDGNYVTSALTAGFNLDQRIYINIKPDTGEKPEIPALCNNPVATGITGSAAWILCPDGTLTICGQGAMQDYIRESDAPWYNYGNCIKAVVIEEGVVNVGQYAFYNFENRYPKLTSLTLPQTLQYIGQYAFLYSEISGTITISNSVIYIGTYALSGCKFTDFEVGAANPVFTAENGVLFNKAKTKIIKYPCAKAGTTYNIPSTVTSIGCSAFSENKEIESIIIPASVNRIEKDAFRACESLRSVVLPAGITEIGIYAFQYCWKLTSVTNLNLVPLVDISDPLNTWRHPFSNINLDVVTLTIPAGSMALYKAAPVWKDFGTIVEKAISVDATLSNLTVNAGTLTPQFSPDITNYTVSVENPTDSITITATKNHAAAFVSGSGTYSLNVGENTFNIAVMAENGTCKTYTVKVTRKEYFVVNETKPVGADGTGKFELAMAIPTDASFNGSFTLVLPGGFQLDSTATRLAAEIASNHELRITKNTVGYWTFVITPRPIRSSSGSIYSKIVEIVYTVNASLSDGKHNGFLHDLSFAFDNGASIFKEVIYFDITVDHSYTNIPAVAKETKIYLSGGQMHVSSPVAETLRVYSVSGVLLYEKRKAAGGISFPVNRIKSSVLIVRGSSGWVRKVIK